MRIADGRAGAEKQGQEGRSRGRGDQCTAGPEGGRGYSAPQAVEEGRALRPLSSGDHYLRRHAVVPRIVHQPRHHLRPPAVARVLYR